MEKICDYDKIDYNAYDWDKFFIKKFNDTAYLCRYGREQKLTTHTILREEKAKGYTYRQEYYQDNKEEFKKAQHTYYWNNREKILQKRRDKNKKLK